MSEKPICPDCKHPVESHAMYRDGRCPVVRFEPKWDVIGHDAPLTDEAIEHLKAGTLPVRLVSMAELREMY